MDLFSVIPIVVLSSRCIEKATYGSSLMSPLMVNLIRAVIEPHQCPHIDCVWAYMNFGGLSGHVLGRTSNTCAISQSQIQVVNLQRVLCSLLLISCLHLSCR